MSTFIANNVKYENNRIYIRGGDNNVVPRDNTWTHYTDNRRFLKNLISGCIDLRCSNVFALKIKAVLKTIEDNHKERYGALEELYANTVSDIQNPYSLYVISTYDKANKEAKLEAMFDVSMYVGSAYKERLIRAGVTRLIYDDAVNFYQEQEKYFLTALNIIG